jgi:hypothetical protein
VSSEEGWEMGNVLEGRDVHDLDSLGTENSELTPEELYRVDHRRDEEI